MKLENQVVSLELAQKMKELGFEQESLFYHNKPKIGGIVASYNWAGVDREDWEIIKEEYVSAYTVAELGELLKPVLNKCFIDYIYEESWYFYIDDDKGNKIYVDDAPNEADARASMLTYLKENKII